MKGIILVCVLALLAGCGIKHEDVRINIPNIRANPVIGPTAFISNVIDVRQMKPGLVGSDKAISIGGIIRDGNGTLINSERPVSEIVHDLVANSLREMGYQVVDNPNGATSTIAVSVIQFDAQFPFSFWRAVGYANHMVSEVETGISVTNSSGKHDFIAKGRGANVFQIESSENWEIAIERGMKDYETDFRNKMPTQ